MQNNQAYDEMMKNVLNSELNEQCKPPKDAFYYIPSYEEQVDHQFKVPNRRIFEGVCEDDYLPIEKKSFSELDAEIEKLRRCDKEFSSLFPDNYSRFNGYRFHQSTHYDCKKTCSDLLAHFKWRKLYANLEYDQTILEILNSGCVYVHGRDSKFRPILVCDFDGFMKLSNKYKPEDFEKTAIKFCDYIIDNMLVPGQVENWILISLMGNVSLWSLPENVKKLMLVMQENYKARLYRNYVIGLSSLMTFLWKIVKLFLDEVTVSKFVFLKANNLKEMHNLVNPEQIEERFGGKAKNATGRLLFPPIMPSDNILLSTDERSKVLISEEEYQKRILRK